MAYGERWTIESCAASMSKFRTAETKKVMETVYRLFAMDTVKTNLGFYLVEGAVSKQAAANLHETQRNVIKQVANHTDDLLKTLNVVEDSLYTPLTKSYERYYSAPNYGEAHNARL